MEFIMSLTSNVSNAPTDVHLSASIFCCQKSQDLQQQNVATLLNLVATRRATCPPGNKIDVRA